MSKAAIDTSVDRVTFYVGFEFLAGAAVDREKGLRFGFDGEDVSAAINIVGTADTPQSGGGARYAGVPELGDHEAAVSYCDQAGEVYTYTWNFTVTE